ncbi:restriction endonuclease subunit S [bacterium]|nr:restriction endonuclease subunit S [bacterium]MBU1993428.1 restriction endonuclease subunit S [bacterium]
MSEVMNVPEGWEVKAIDTYFKLKSGETKPIDTASYGNYPVYGGNGITGYTDSINNNKETLIIGRVGEYCGSIYLVKKCWITDNALFIEKQISKFNMKYMFYKLSFLNLNQYKAETGQPLLNQTIIGNLQINLPKELEEQQKIAKILSTLDKTIESTAKLIDKEKSIKKGLMHDLLTNGIDKNNKIRTPQTHLYKQSELGLIPEEWEVVNLGSIVKIVGGGTPSRDIDEYWKNGTIPWVTVKDLHDGLIIEGDTIKDSCLDISDGFYDPHEQTTDYVVFGNDNASQNIYFLHGGLHIFDKKSEIIKNTFSRTEKSLKDQTLDNLNKDIYPIFVSEGTSEQKKAKIIHNAYLNHCFKSLASIGTKNSSLVIFGTLLKRNGIHIRKAIIKSKVPNLYIGVANATDASEFDDLIEETKKLKYPKKIYFYDYRTAKVWR